MALDRVNTLKKAYFLADLPYSALEKLSTHLVDKTYTFGDRIFGKFNTRINAWYFIKEGEVKLFRKKKESVGEDDKEQIERLLYGRVQPASSPLPSLPTQVHHINSLLLSKPSTHPSLSTPSPYLLPQCKDNYQDVCIKGRGEGFGEEWYFDEGVCGYDGVVISDKAVISSISHNHIRSILAPYPLQQEGTYPHPNPRHAPIHNQAPPRLQIPKIQRNHSQLKILQNQRKTPRQRPLRNFQIFRWNQWEESYSELVQPPAEVEIRLG